MWDIHFEVDFSSWVIFVLQRNILLNGLPLEDAGILEVDLFLSNHSISDGRDHGNVCVSIFDLDGEGGVVQIDF